MIKQRLLVTGLVLAGCGMSVGSAMAEGGGWYINPMIGEQEFDDERNVEEDTTGILGVEYRYGDHWATELRYLDTSARAELGNQDVDVSQYFIDGLYYFQPASATWQPYGVFGVGYAEYERGQDVFQDEQANLGFGTRVRLDEHWSLRADARGIYGFEENDFDQLYSIGISFVFGGDSGAAPEPKQKPMEPVTQDSDGDGVIDSVDECPETPAGASVGNNGCALDTDGDGVVDYLDQCPDTPSGRSVDANGCKELLARDVEVTLSVTFDLNSARVQQESLPNIEEAAEFLKSYPEVDIEIGGHTDSSGSASYNQRLSQRRAEAVRDVLVDYYAIDPNRITARGYGEERPVASNETAEGRAANRRVVATLKATVKE